MGVLLSGGQTDDFSINGGHMIILTGVSGGIGREILPYLLEIDQVLGIYNKTEPQSLTNKRLVYEQLNLENSAEIQSFVSKWKNKLSKVTLIHFAALKIDNLTTNYKEVDWDCVMGVNLKGNFLLTQALLPHMVQERWGRLIHISSRGAVEGDIGTIAYSTSKTGLIGMSRVLAKEYARFNITSNVLALGHFEVGLYAKLNDDLRKNLLNQIPSKTLGKASDLFSAIEFLIKSQYVNGAVINIDGGI